MRILEAYKYYLADQEVLDEMVSFFAEEVNLSDERLDELFHLVTEEHLTSFQFANLIECNYGHTLCMEVFEPLLEQTSQSDLIRKRRIEKERKKLGSQFKAQKGDTEEQRLQKSTLSLSTFKVDKQGRFVQRSKQGDLTKIRKNLEAKRARSKSTKGKIDAAKATERRKKQATAGSKVGAAKFVQNLKLAA